MGVVTYLLTCCDGGKTKSTPSPTDLDWTVRLDWSLTKIPSNSHISIGGEADQIIKSFRFSTVAFILQVVSES